MGRTLIKLLAESKQARLVAAVERAGHADLGRDAGELAGAGAAGVLIGADPDAALAVSDVWIDFTAPGATVAAVALAARKKVAFVAGTTGLDDTGRAALAVAAQEIPVVASANMSVGVNVLCHLLAQAARALGPGFDLEIVEAHHRHKKDAPSGTALMMAQALAEAAGRDLSADARYGREGAASARTAREIGILAVRGGDVVGDHTLELTHRASSRDTFARGALRAALFTQGRPAGLYDMRDVLGMR
jgi:4-hydroxy-tetrahydrodipicolinate reductase